jgi:hypothetical protein
MPECSFASRLDIGVQTDDDRLASHLCGGDSVTALACNNKGFPLMPKGAGVSRSIFNTKLVVPDLQSHGHGVGFSLRPCSEKKGSIRNCRIC